jgi:hypothetical protein
MDFRTLQTRDDAQAFIDTVAQEYPQGYGVPTDILVLVYVYIGKFNLNVPRSLAPALGTVP